PGAIERDLKLRQPIYEETARYGHMGRTPEVVTKTFINGNGKPFQQQVELFTWEKLDRVADVKHAFGIE
ncbi:MAG: methionine adenosyltransferase, partial [Paludibacteraceae bacterium]|nr:methionine adenosyltransferase [Paludibacteraceae bacterium]